MHRSDVFVGSILKINNAEDYNQYGNTSNNLTDYVELYRALAVLVKTRNEKYVWIRNVNSFIKELLLDLNIPLDTMGSVATYDGELIVDEASLIHYYGPRDLEDNKRVYAKSLRMELLLDPRLPDGITYQ